MNDNIDLYWDENPIDVTQEANFIWGIANKLRGVYMPDKYGDVIIPMTILRRFECTLKPTKAEVVKEYEADPSTPYQKLCKTSGCQFYNTSHFDLKELCNDADHLSENLKSYIDGFSKNVANIFEELEFDAQIKKMDAGGCLYTVIKAFSEDDMDLSPERFDSIKMGYIFENLIGRFFQNVDAGQFYTGRDIIKTLVSVLISEGCDDILESYKEITVCDQACGTGGMLTTAYTYFKHYNPTCNVRLFGQEYNPVSHAIGLAEMLIKGQDARNFVNADTFKQDCFEGTKMRFVIENPPFGTPWGGKDAKEGQEESVKKEFGRGLNGRWGAGLPGTGDGQLLFLQSGIAKLTDNGRAAIISNGSPLFTGGTASGESQIRRYLLEHDLIDAIIGLPTDLFYNTGIATYVWIISKNKSERRKGKIQLIDATNIYHKLRKPQGLKRNELLPEDRLEITNLYTNFEENEFSKIFDNEEFLYREYTVMQPLQRSYAINEERIENLISKNILSCLYDENKVYELENSGKKLSDKEQKQLDKFIENKPLYDEIIEILNNHISNDIYLKKGDFEEIIKNIFADIIDKKYITKIVEGLSMMDKKAEIQIDKKGNILYDKETKDTEIVPYKQNIDDYMEKEVLPHIPDAKAFFEGKDEENTFEMDFGEKVIRIGAEIPFTRYFYKYQAPTPSEELAKQFVELENSVNERIQKLFGGNL